ncbi:MAG: DUF4136 domain-containing protein [Bacteroidota bacterium]|nr:DUF4136 domain-containing protein [Bacteroidota bacterium]
MSKIKFLVIALCLSIAGIFSSCYTDYGIDAGSSEVVVTLYNNQYNFAPITKYNLVDSVLKLGSGLPNTYDSLILQQMKAQLNGLGWVETNDPLDTGAINVGAGITSSTVVVNEGYDYWGYYGYGWYYPSYGSGYTYTYTTGTLIMLMTDLNLADGTRTPVQWSGIINAAIGEGTTTPTLITTGITQAFSQAQSPYLR